jgi:hypothetical protein
LRNETHAEFIVDFSDLVKKIGAGSLGVTTQFVDYEKVTAIELGTLDVILHSPLTVKIEWKSHDRENVHRGFSLGVDAAMHHPDATIREAAFTIRAILDHYGDVTKKNYDDASALTTDMIRELETAINKALVVAAGLVEWVTQLKIVNDAFISLMHARDAEVALRPTIPMKKARLEVDKALHVILARVEAMITLNGIDYTAGLAPFVSEYNILAERYKHRLAVEKGRRAAKREKEEEEGEENYE